MQKHLLVGNGLIIQYGGVEYNNESIINRTIENVKNGRYEDDMLKTLSPDDAHQFFILVKREVRSIINGKYDQFALLPTEKEALLDFKIRYPKSKSFHSDVGFEDYFLILRLIFNKFKDSNETRAGATTALRRLFLDAIYNGGKINEIHGMFPAKLLGFLKNFKCIFTTNYDCNIENFTGMEVHHLHGQFDVLESVYDIDSLRNKISDKPAENFNIPREYRHTYCNALMDFSKDFQFNMNKTVNVGLSKLAAAYKDNNKVRDDVNTWAGDSLHAVRNLYEGLMYKLDNPDVCFYDYSISKFQGIVGQLEVLGLSPKNDLHILKIARDNSELSLIKYYYFDKSDGDVVNEFFSTKKIVLKNVRGLWEALTH